MLFLYFLFNEFNKTLKLFKEFEWDQFILELID